MLRSSLKLAVVRVSRGIKGARRAYALKSLSLGLLCAGVFLVWSALMVTATDPIAVENPPTIDCPSEIKLGPPPGNAVPPICGVATRTSGGPVRVTISFLHSPGVNLDTDSSMDSGANSFCFLLEGASPGTTLGITATPLTETGEQAGDSSMTTVRVIACPPSGE